MYDFIYDNQEIISAANAWTKMMEYAGQSGLDADPFKACMSGRKPARPSTPAAKTANSST